MVYDHDMYAEAFKACDLDEKALILDILENTLKPVQFDPLDTDILKLPLSFYKGYNLLIIKSGIAGQHQTRHVVYHPNNFQVLDYTAQTVLDLNASIPVNITRDTVLDYIEFYLRYVRGPHGFFNVVHDINDIRWKEPPPGHARQSVADMITPLMIKTQSADDIFKCAGTVMFENGLFTCDITVTGKTGKVKIDNQNLLIKDMPVYDTPIDV